MIFWPLDLASGLRQDWVDMDRANWLGDLGRLAAAYMKHQAVRGSGLRPSLMSLSIVKLVMVLKLVRVGQVFLGFLRTSHFGMQYYIENVIVIARKQFGNYVLKHARFCPSP